MLFVSVLSYGQGVEDFTNSNATSSYSDNNFVGAGGITWSYVKSRNANGDANSSGISLPALMLQKAANNSTITSSAIPGGIGNFSVKLYKGFTSSGNRQVELFINGVSKGVSIPFNDTAEHVFSVTGINVTGNVVIELKNTTSKQVIIDDITWTMPSTTPSINITSPSNNTVFLATTTQVPVTVTLSNFMLSAATSAGASNGAGNGYIKTTITKDGVIGTPSSNFSTTLNSINVVPGSAYNVVAELVDNTGASLATPVSSSVNFTTLFMCDVSLGTILKECNTTTSATDLYKISIPFTGGATSTYTITTDNGTIGGDNPSTTAAGTVLISGVSEGTDVVFTLNGAVTNSSCAISKTILSPSCSSFPIIEHFDYTVGANLGDQNLWSKNNAGDEIIVEATNLDYSDLDSSMGGLISFNHGGSESYLSFPTVTSGTVYASFLLKVTAFQTSATPDLVDGGYIAALAASASSYDARFWIRPNPDTAGTTFDIGYGAETANPTFTTTSYHLNDILFVVLSYSMDTGLLNAWINPTATSFEATIPAATLSTTDPNPPAAIKHFVLRQDSNKETPFVEIDALRIATSWAAVTPKAVTAMLSKNGSESFSLFPNPITDKKFTLISANNFLKEVAMFSVLGKKVFSTSFSNTKKQLRITNIKSGIYILKVTENGKTVSKKMVIK